MSKKKDKKLKEKLERILDVIDDYAFLAQEWEPRKEDDYLEFKRELRKVLEDE